MSEYKVAQDSNSKQTSEQAQIGPKAWLCLRAAGDAQCGAAASWPYDPARFLYIVCPLVSSSVGWAS